MRRHIAILAAALALSLPALAAGGGSPPAGNAKRQDAQQRMKEDILAHIDDKIRILQEARACIRAASAMKAVSECHAQERRKTKALREQTRSNMLERKALRDERRGPPPASAAK